MVFPKKKPGVKGKAAAKKTGAAKINPFELKFNKVKHDVLGKKKGTLGVGHPGLSRKRATEHRQQSLAIEYDHVGKVNKIVDKRLGEHDKTMTAEEKASKRFALERVSAFKKKSKFNLADDDFGDDSDEEQLTHGGKALTTIQKYEKMDGDSDEEGAIGADVVAMAHFGGGEMAPGPKGDKESKAEQRKNFIDELISRTKQQRVEKAAAKDELEEKTDKLDELLKSVMKKGAFAMRPVGASKDEPKNRDDYDKLMLDMKMTSEKRAAATDASKSELDMAREAKARLEEAEKARLARMNMQTNARQHRSADDDEAIVDHKKMERKKKGFTVQFDDDGQLIQKGKVEKASVKRVRTDSEEDGSDEEDSDEEESGSEDGDLDDMLVGDESDNEPGENDEEEDFEDDGVPAPKKSRVADQDSDVPFVLPMPKNYSQVKKLFDQHKPTDTLVIIERLMKCHHQSFQPGNKALLVKLFLLCLRYFDETSQQAPSVDVQTRLAFLHRGLYKLLRLDIEFGTRCIRALLRQLWKKRSADSKSQRAPVGYAVTAAVRLVAAIYPVTDVWHPVCTPAFALATAVLTSVQITSLTVLARQLFLATALSEYVEESKRVIPELLAFLTGALLCAVESGDKERAPSNVFPISAPHRHLLLVNKNLSKSELSAVSLEEVFGEGLDDTEENRCAVLRALVALTQKMAVVYSAHSLAYNAMFSPMLTLVSRIDQSKLPTCLAEEVEALQASMKAECERHSSISHLSQMKTEQSMLKMLEPVFEENFDPERPRSGRDPTRHGKQADSRKMAYLVKKETRGVIKELRKDNTFLARKHRRDVAVKDEERKNKVNKIMAGLQGQESEAKKLEWQKKKKF